MRKVELRMNETEKYEIIKELVDHNGNKNRASKKLSISRRQVDRLIIKYKEKGKSCFVHGNREHIPSKALDKSISEDIILLYTTKYQDWNFRHFKEFLIEKENIDVSYDFIYKHLTKQGILSPKARKKTKKEFAKKRL
ncbi:MAG: helix-turn-helix domain-containing protein, partial [Bacilli bacterium]